jgi:hypothetical protein
MSRTAPAPVVGAAAEARAQLAEEEHADFDRLVHGVLSTPGAARQPALGAALRGPLPGTEGIRWLRGQGLSTTARASALTAEHWLSLYRTWHALQRTPAAANGRPTGGRPGRVDSTHGHAPGAQAAPRWY